MCRTWESPHLSHQPLITKRHLHLNGHRIWAVILHITVGASAQALPHPPNVAVAQPYSRRPPSTLASGAAAWGWPGRRARPS